MGVLNLLFFQSFQTFDVKQGIYPKEVEQTEKNGKIFLFIVRHGFKSIDFIV